MPLVSEDYEVLLLAFCGFEALLGVYWPAIALLRSSELSDAQRSSTMSVFRSLLNLLVIGVLLLVGQLPERLIFGMALAMLLTCAANVSIIQASHLVRQRAIDDAYRGGTFQEGAKLIVASSHADEAESNLPLSPDREESSSIEMAERRPPRATQTRSSGDGASQYHATPTREE